MSGGVQRGDGHRAQMLMPKGGGLRGGGGVGVTKRAPWRDERDRDRAMYRAQYQVQA